MVQKRGSLVLLLALLLGAVVLLPAAAATVPAALPSACALPPTTVLYPERWLAVWNFDTAVGCVLYTGPALPGQPAPIDHYELIECRPVGTTIFDSGVLALDGEGALECPFAIDKHQIARYELVTIDVAAALDQPGPNPIVSHPSFSLAAPVSAAGTAGLRWSFQHTDGSIGQYAAGEWPVEGMNTMSVIACPSDKLRCANHVTGRYQQMATFNGQSSDPVVVPHAVMLDLAPTTLYIGAELKDGAGFRGKLDWLVIDPAYGKDPQPNFDAPTPTPAE